MWSFPTIKWRKPTLPAGQQGLSELWLCRVAASAGLAWTVLGQRGTGTGSLRSACPMWAEQAAPRLEQRVRKPGWQPPPLRAAGLPHFAGLLDKTVVSTPGTQHSVESRPENQDMNAQRAAPGHWPEPLTPPSSFPKQPWATSWNQSHACPTAGEVFVLCPWQVLLHHSVLHVATGEVLVLLHGQAVWFIWWEAARRPVLPAEASNTHVDPIPQLLG